MSTKPKHTLVTRSSGSVSFQEETGTVEIVYSTGLRRDNGDYFEELVISPEAIDATRLDAGAVSLIVDHMPIGLPIGRVISHRVENGEAIATVKLSEAEANAGVVADIKAGVIRQVSVGYEQLAFEDSEVDGVRQRLVTRWMPWEISLVVIPADPAAHIRSNQGAPHRRSEVTMNPEELLAAAAAAVAAAAAKLAEAQESGDADAITAAEAAVAEAAAELEAAQAAVDAAAAAEGAGDGDEETRSAATAEETRVAAVVEYATRNRIAPDLLTRHIVQRHTVEEVQRMHTQNRASRSALPVNTTRAQVHVDEKEKTFESMTDALSARMTGRAPSARGREFANFKLRDIAREIVGRSSRGMSDRTLFSAVLQTRSGMHSSSDFAAVLSNSANKALLDRYQAAPKTHEPLVRRVEHADYKEVEKFRIGDAPKFKRRAEGAEVEFGTMSENVEKFRVYNETAGIGFTFETFVNDDLDVFGDLSRSFGTNAALREAELVFDILTKGYKMADGKQLFHSTRGNLITAGLSIEGLDQGMTAMETQESLDGNVIGITPKILLVGPKNRLTGQRLLANITPASAEDVNPFGNSNLQLIVDPRITDLSWFLVADPTAYDGIQLASLAGSQGVQLETIENFYKRSIDFIASIDIGAAPIDYRPLVKSTGTGQ